MGLTILDLPTDLLVDCILPLLPLHDFINFTSTCLGFHRLSNDEVYFRNLTYKTFRFPAQPLRQEGWKALFQQIATSRLFTWGAAGESRLGHSWPIRTYEGRGIAYPTEPELKGVEGMVVDITAGGWSTAFLTSTGAAYLAGSLRENGNPLAEGFTRLKFPNDKDVKLSQISSGRGCIIALDDENQLWQWGGVGGRNSPQDVGTIVPVGLPANELHKIRNIRAGWTTISAYIDGHGICVGNLSDLDRSRVPGTNGFKSADPNASTLEGKIGKIVEYIVLEKYLLFLSDTGSLYAYDLDRDDPPLHLPTFSALEGEEPLCYLSGSFRNFAVFNKSGLVLLGTRGMLDEVFAPGPLGEGQYAESVSATYDLTTPLTPKNEIHPNIKESLQNRHIIKISFGDYHALALTQSGKVLTWGTQPQDSGCFGLGPADEASAKGATRAHNGRDSILEDPTEVNFFVPSLLDQGEQKKWSGDENPDFFAFNIEAAGWHSGALVSCPRGYPNVYRQVVTTPPPESQPRGPRSIRDRFAGFGNLLGRGQTPQTTPSQYTGPSNPPTTTSASLPPRHNSRQAPDTPTQTLDENYIDPDAIASDDEMNYDDISDDDLAVQNHALHPPRRTQPIQQNSSSSDPAHPQPGATPNAPSSSSSHPNPNANIQYAPDNAPRYDLDPRAALNPFMAPFLHGGLGPVIPQNVDAVGHAPPSNQSRNILPDGSAGTGELGEDRYGHAQGNA